MCASGRLEFAASLTTTMMTTTSITGPTRFDRGGGGKADGNRSVDNRATGAEAKNPLTVAILGAWKATA